MKRMFFILFLIVVFSTQVIAQKIVAVATFDIVSNVVSNVVSKEDAETITELYIAELLASGKVIVASRTKFNKTLAEFKFQESDWSNFKKNNKARQCN